MPSARTGWTRSRRFGYRKRQIARGARRRSVHDPVQVNQRLAAPYQHAVRRIFLREFVACRQSPVDKFLEPQHRVFLHAVRIARKFSLQGEMMPEAFLCSFVRTPFGRYAGALSAVRLRRGCRRPRKNRTDGPAPRAPGGRPHRSRRRAPRPRRIHPVASAHHERGFEPMTRPPVELDRPSVLPAARPGAGAAARIPRTLLRALA